MKNKKIASIVVGGLLLAMPIRTIAGVNYDSTDIDQDCISLGEAAEAAAEIRDAGKPLKEAIVIFDDTFDKKAGGKSKENQSEKDSKHLYEEVVKSVYVLPYLYPGDEAVRVIINCENLIKTAPSKTGKVVDE